MKTKHRKCISVKVSSTYPSFLFLLWVHTYFFQGHYFLCLTISCLINLTTRLKRHSNNINKIKNLNSSIRIDLKWKHEYLPVSAFSYLSQVFIQLGTLLNGYRSHFNRGHMRLY